MTLHPSKDSTGEQSVDQWQSLYRYESASTKEEFGALLLEHLQDISTNLRGLAKVHEESLDTLVEQQRDLLGVARQMNKALRDLADTLSGDHLTPD